MDVDVPTQLDAPYNQTTEDQAIVDTIMEPTHELHDHQALDSSASSSNQLNPLSQETSRLIRIPLRLILDVMLKDLGLPEAEYHLESCENSEFCVTVRFHASQLPLEESHPYRSITGISCTSYEMAEDITCEQVIRNVEAATNTVVNDLSYQRMKLSKWTVRFLLRRLKDEHLYKMKLARGWFLAVRHMSSFSNQVLSVTYLNRSAGENDLVMVWNNLLNNFEDLGFRLKRAGADLEKTLEKMRRNYFS